MSWIPDARYEDGFFATGSHPAVGWQIPQPWVTDDTGAIVRLDDVLGGQWAVLHTGAPPAGAQAWTELGARRSASANPRWSAGCTARRRPPSWCGPTDSSMPQAESGESLPVPPAITRNELEYPHDRRQPDRTHRHRQRKTDLRRRDRQWARRGHAARRRARRIGCVQLLAQHRRARAALPGHRPRHARLWPLGTRTSTTPIRSATSQT